MAERDLPGDNGAAALRDSRPVYENGGGRSSGGRGGGYVGGREDDVRRPLPPFARALDSPPRCVCLCVEGVGE